MNKASRNRIRGQVQLGESTAVIIIVIILLFFGVLFWNRANSSSVSKLASQSQELDVIQIANLISGLPELKCYDAGVSSVACIDIYKAEAMASLANNSQQDMFMFYNDYFKNSRITIEELYPESVNITIYDARLANSTKTLLIPIPVNIENVTSGETGYGLIIVEGYYIGG